MRHNLGSKRQVYQQTNQRGAPQHYQQQQPQKQPDGRRAQRAALLKTHSCSNILTTERTVDFLERFTGQLRIC